MDHLPMLSLTGLAVVAALFTCVYASSIAWGMAMTQTDCRRCHGTDDAVIVAFHHGVRDANNWSCTQCHKPVSDGTGGYTITVERNCTVCHGPGYHTEPAGTNPQRHHAIRNAYDYGCLHCHPAVQDDTGSYTIVVTRDCFFCHVDGQKQWRQVKWLNDLPSPVAPDTTATTTTDITSKFHDTIESDGYQVSHTTAGDKALSIRLEKDASLTSKVTLSLYVMEPPVTPTIIRIYPYLLDGETVDTSVWKDFPVNTAGYVQCDVTSIAVRMAGFTWMKYRVTAFGAPLMLSEGFFDILRSTTDGTTNQIPISSAGPDRLVSVGEAIAFSGAGSTDAEGGIIAYTWDFGDGTIGTGMNVSHVYTTGGTYLVSLKVTDDKGAVGEDFAFVNVKAPSLPPNQPPVANAGPDIVTTAGQVFTLSGTASRDVDGQVASYTWSFHDGTSATGETVSKIFHNTGIYTVTLTITDNRGTIATDTVTITVLAPAGGNAVPIAKAGTDAYASVGEAVTFSGAASSDPDGTISSYAWDFGDGTKGTGVSPVKTYSTAGVYVVTLVVTDNGGAKSTDTLTMTIHNIIKQNQPPLADSSPVNISVVAGQAIVFTGAASLDPDGSIASYSWNFGDGTSAIGSSVTKTYNTAGIFTITLTVTDNGGATGTSTSVATVQASANVSPVANAGPDATGAPAQTLTFSGSGSSDSDGTITSYSWDFGNGTTSTDMTASTVYTGAGTFTVKLVVTDNMGATSSDTAIVTIKEQNQPPKANAGPDKTAAPGKSIAFSGSGSSDTDGTISSYKWSFGDGTSKTGLNVTKSYATAGTYTVTLTVTDNSGAIATDTAIVTVTTPVNVAPIANAGRDVSGTTGQNISFGCTGSSDADGSIVSYLWSFGDGSSKSGCNVTKSYAVAGKYTVTLTVTDNSGAKGTDTAIATIAARTRR
nr:PKD domain-containing protein [Pelotalea chapellei]